MKALQRRMFIVPLIAASIAVGAPSLAQAQQKFPTKPIRLVVATTPGSTPDILARLIGAKMGESWGQPVVIENRPGALGALGATLVTRATPDGHTLMLVSPAFAIRAALVPQELPYDSLKDFAGVSEIGHSTGVVIAAPSLGVRSVKEFIAFAQAQPGKIFFGSAGAGSATHLAAERFRVLAGIKAQHVAFKGQAEFQLEIAAGRIHFGSTGLTAALPFIQSGKLVPLVVNMQQRTPLLPDVPAMVEVFPGYVRVGAQSILAPAGTPRPIRQQISREVARILGLPDIRERLHAVGFHIEPSTPEEHDRNLRNDIAMFSKIVVDAGLKPK